MKDQPIRGERAHGGPAEDHLGRLLELDDDLRAALPQRLARAQIDRHTFPAPVVDEESHCRVGLRLGRRIDVLLLAISRLVAGGSVLASHRVMCDLVGREVSHRLKHLRLFVADGVRFERGRRFHADVGQHLQHVVLHHVPQHAGRVVVAAPALDVDRLGDVELDVVDIVFVPQRFEHAVGEAERQQVLHRLFSEIVIDAVDLVFVPVRQHLAVELERGVEVRAERLLDDDPLPARAVLEAGRVQVVAQRAEEARRDREVEEDVAAGADLGVEPADLHLQGLERLHVREPAGQVVETADQLVPHRLVEHLAGVELLDLRAHALAERRRVPHIDRCPEHRELLGQQAVAGEIEDRRHKQTLREVAGRSEENHDARVARRAVARHVDTWGTQDHGWIGHS